MPDWRLVADDKQYAIPEKLTLGEQNTLAKDFGIGNMSEFELTNIRHVSGLLFVAMCREQPNIAKSSVRVMLDAVTTLDIVDLDPEPEAQDEEMDPTPAGAADAAPGAPGE